MTLKVLAYCLRRWWCGRRGHHASRANLYVCKLDRRCSVCPDCGIHGYGLVHIAMNQEAS